MTLLRYLILMAAGTGICWGAWYVSLRYIDPMTTGVLGFSLFYLSLLFALAGTFAVVGFFIRLVLLKQELVFQKVVVAYRQGIFFALLVVGLLLLQSFRLLTWYNVMFLIIGLTILEFFMISRRPMRYR